MALPQTEAAAKAADRLAAAAQRLHNGQRGQNLKVIDHRFIIAVLGDYVHKVAEAIRTEATNAGEPWRHSSATASRAHDLTAAIDTAGGHVNRAAYAIGAAAENIQRDVQDLHITDRESAMSAPGQRLRRTTWTALDTAEEWHGALRGARSTTFAEHAHIIDLTRSMLTDIAHALDMETRLTEAAYNREPAGKVLGGRTCELLSSTRKPLRLAQLHLHAALAVVTAAADQATAS